MELRNPQFCSSNDVKHLNANNGSNVQVGNRVNTYYNYNGPNQTINVNANAPDHSDAFSSTAESSERAKRTDNILRALYVCPYKDRKNLNPDIVPGTCKWFESHTLFKKWRHKDSSRILWVSADPGCGKSVLTKHLVDNIIKSSSTTTVCYFFFKDVEDQKGATTAISCILRQLFLESKTLLSDSVLEQFERESDWFTKSFDLLWTTLITAAKASDAGEIIIILDAVDECQDGDRTKLFEALTKLYKSEQCLNLKFIITSRPFDSIRQGFQPLEDSRFPIVHLSGEGDEEVENISKEIDLVIKMKIQEIAQTKGLTLEEKNILLEQLIKVPNRTYLWAQLTLELIKRAISIDKLSILQITTAVPQSVDEAYEKILSQSCDEHKARKMLHIVVAAARPLTTKEMATAVSVTQDNSLYDELSPEQEYRFCKTLRDVCGLITIVDSKLYLLHQTVKEFLVPIDDQVQNKDCLISTKWKGSIQPQLSHSILVNICIWYLLYSDSKFSGYSNKNVDRSTYAQDLLFLDYPANNWPMHFRQIPHEKQLELTKSALELCAFKRSRFSWFRWHWHSKNGPFPRRTTSLIIASYFGLETVVRYLIMQKDADLDFKDQTYSRSPLCWATMNGFGSVAKLLIEGVPTSQKFPLRYLKRRPKINLKDIDGRTPLIYSIWNNDISTARALLRRGAKLNLSDNVGGTPITYAICNGQKEAIDLLLKRSTNSKSVDTILTNLLFAALQNNDETVAKMVLESDKVNIDTCFQDDLTPLSFAIKLQSGPLVTMLLKIGGANINIKDKNGQTPLHAATASRGNEAIVKILLDTGKADVNMKDKNGQTPLHAAAASRRNEAVVKLLLDTGKADVNVKDKNGQTPLHVAAAAATVRRMTFPLKMFSSTPKDENGPKPLHDDADSSRNEASVKMLLDIGKANVNVKDKNGRTPLHFAAIGSRNEALVKVLLDTGKADVNAQDWNCSTPLNYASSSGNYTIARILHDVILGNTPPDMEA